MSPDPRAFILGFKITQTSYTMPSQAKIKSERDTFGFRNSRTTANKLFSDTSNVLGSATATAS